MSNDKSKLFVLVYRDVSKYVQWILRGDAGQNAPPGGNSCHTTCKTPEKVLAAFFMLNYQGVYTLCDSK